MCELCCKIYVKLKKLSKYTYSHCLCIDLRDVCAVDKPPPPPVNLDPYRPPFILNEPRYVNTTDRKELNCRANNYRAGLETTLIGVLLIGKISHHTIRLSEQNQRTTT